MHRVRLLIDDRDYRGYLAENANRESVRPFCRHDLAHLLDVARIAWILCLEQGQSLERSVVYAAALLHDIGRFLQYDDPSVDHAEASSNLAWPLLLRSGYGDAEIALITAAILCHRQPPEEVQHSLGKILARADDLARLCFLCDSSRGCYKYQRMETRCGIQY